MGKRKLTPDAKGRATFPKEFLKLFPEGTSFDFQWEGNRAIIIPLMEVPIPSKEDLEAMQKGIQEARDGKLVELDLDSIG